MSDLDVRFNYHKPDEVKVQRHESIRHRCKAIAESFIELVPQGRELSLALTKLEEAMMWANAGIAREGKA